MRHDRLALLLGHSAGQSVLREHYIKNCGPRDLDTDLKAIQFPLIEHAPPLWASAPIAGVVTGFVVQAVSLDCATKSGVSKRSHGQSRGHRGGPGWSVFEVAHGHKRQRGQHQPESVRSQEGTGVTAVQCQR